MKSNYCGLLIMILSSALHAHAPIDNVALAKKTHALSNEILETRLQESHEICRSALMESANATKKSSSLIRETQYLLASFSLGDARRALRKGSDCLQQTKIQNFTNELNYISDQIAGLD
ncbi:hypothetical protein [Legionella bononiensis]|uniref:Uncharacterized protein n=1 Tax=Legionella bononiensis TaxID=2793102 RepID=A0ABS1WD39_9GAMM|nr:hypothetical protein [Legionella bononiensis]MBL7479140.1 hypothetical protein [Legionella bononiensis]MBL7527273.1 hypothetical protein [Legionella bononiensis]MBL7562242.1 hypothetical protein [Legionella bononiensis]